MGRSLKPNSTPHKEIRRFAPNVSLLEAGVFPARELAGLAKREGRRPRPIYMVHKWFARRLGCVFRALLVGGTCGPNENFWRGYYGSADLRGRTVLDPFVGGGTSVVEAWRLGAAVIGVDVDQVACTVTRFELLAAALPDLQNALTELQVSVGNRVRRFHSSRDDRGVERIVLHHFWVQVVTCRDCGESFDAHPTFLLADDEKFQWVVCSNCGEVCQRRSGRQKFRCGACAQFTSLSDAIVSHGTASCPKCDDRRALIDIGRAGQSPPSWKLFALEVLDEHDGGRPVPMAKRRFVRASESDIALYAEASKLCAARRRSNPDTFPKLGISKRLDSRLFDYGYRQWTDLFNDRQLLHLSLLAEAIAGFKEPVRRALAVAFSAHLTTNCMMTAYATGWRRLTPIFSIHAFRHVPRPVELNPWCDGTGRGTYPNAVKKLVRAAEFSRRPKEPLRRGGFKTVPRKSALGVPTIACATAQDLSFLPDRSVDIVLTDPPYFDNIAYSDLAEFFLPWMEMIGLIKSSRDGTRVSLESLLGRRNDAQATGRYTLGLSAAFGEIARVLVPSGLLLFTFRHAVADAWKALATSLARASLTPTQFLPAPGEAGVGLHAHAGTGLWDAVFVLRKSDRPLGEFQSIDEEGTKYVQSAVTTWAKRLAGAPIAFKEVDKLTLRRAGFVAVSLGLLKHRQLDRTMVGLTPLEKLL